MKNNLELIGFFFIIKIFPQMENEKILFSNHFF